MVPRRREEDCVRVPDRSRHRSRVRAPRSNPLDGGIGFIATSMPGLSERSYGGPLDNAGVKSPLGEAFVRYRGGTAYRLMA